MEEFDKITYEKRTFKIGDKIEIPNVLLFTEEDGELVDEMEIFIGEEVEITGIYKDDKGYYFESHNIWNWSLDDFIDKSTIEVKSKKSNKELLGL